MKHLETASGNGEASAEKERNELIAGCLNGERWAQNKLYTENYRDLFGVYLSYMKDHGQAEDLLQEVFIIFYLSLRLMGHRKGG